MNPRWALMDEADGGDKGGAGGDAGDKGAGDKGAAGEHSEMLLRGLAVIAKGVTEMQESNKQVLSFLKENAEKKSGGEGDDGGEHRNTGSAPAAGGLFEGVDMEQLDRKDFAALLLSKFDERLQHHMKEAVKPIEDRVGKLGERVENDFASREISAAAGQRPDFYEWRTEIAELVKHTPGLSVTRAYTIARAENTDKAKKMDEKYTKKTEPQTRGFTGLSPTGGGGRGEGAGKMKFNEAANKAFDDVLASLGGVSLDQLPVVGKQQH